MKRNGGIFTFLTIMFSSLASAGPVEGAEQLARGANEIIMIIVQFLSDVIFNLDSFNELLFAKILLALIIFFVTYTVLRRNEIFGRDKKIAIIITSAITILAIRYLPTNFVEAILLQYSVFAVAITTLLPFIIFFFFLHQSEIGGFGRRAGWILYGASFIAMWVFRYDDMGNANYIYWIGISFVIASLIFDKSIHRYFGLSGLRRVTKEGKEERRRVILRKIDTLQEDNKKGIVDDTTYDKEIKILKDNYKSI